MACLPYSCPVDPSPAQRQAELRQEGLAGSPSMRRLVEDLDASLDL